MKHLICTLALLLLGSAGLYAHGHHQAPLKSPAVDALKQGDFQRAARLLPGEIKANPNEARLKKIYAALKTQLRREKLFAEERDPGMIVLVGSEMRKFYTAWGLYDKAAAAGEKIYAASPSLQNGVNWGVSLLNADKNTEAAAVFGKLDLSKADPGPSLCGALAFARVGKKDESRKILDRFDTGKLSLNFLGLYARSAALNGDSDKAAELAAKILEKSPAKQHPNLKKNLFGSADFKSVAGNEKFKAALKTASKVEDECAGCPNHGTDKCDHKHGH